MELQNKMEEYLSTGQAAKMLGLTIATIQKMTETGILSAYMTPGGHRRILYSSFNQFCHSNQLKETHTTPVKHLVCIMHNQTNSNHELDTISQFPNVKVICTPLDLIGLQGSDITLFMDARLPWLNETIFQTNSQFEHNANFYLYNSEVLSGTNSLKLNPNLTAIEGDINRNLIYGYLLKYTNSPIVDSSIRHAKKGYTDRPKISNASSKRLKNDRSIKGKRMSKPANPAVNVTGKPTA